MDNLSQTGTNGKSPFIELLLFLATAFGFMTLFSFLGMAVIYYFFGITTFDFSNPEDILPAKILQFFNALGLFVIPPVFFYQVIKKENISWQFSGNIKFELLLLSVALIYTIMPSVEWLAEINKMLPVPESWQPLLKQMEQQTIQATKAMLHMTNTADFLFSVIIIGVLPALGEEMFFRGVLQRIFIRWTNNLWAGVLITAFLFSVLHMEFSGLLPRLVLGIVLGLLYAWSGNLWYSVLVHFLNNTSVVVYIYIKHINVENLEDLEMMDTISPVAGIVSLAVASGLLYYFYRKTQLLRK